ncbi:MAG TPA: hypothetical protein VKP01_11760 [Saliniramus sp.]|nr:hypothetical protein [Saliniramus sp.]
MSVLMTMSFQPRNEMATQPSAAERAWNGNRNVAGGAAEQAGASPNVWRDPAFTQAMQASGAGAPPVQTGGPPATTIPGPLVGNAGASAGAMVGALANDLARTFAEAPAPDSARQMSMLQSLSRHIANEEARTYTPAPARSDYVLNRESGQTDNGNLSASAYPDSLTDGASPQADEPTGHARTTTRPPTQDTIPHLDPAGRAIFAADGHLTPHANPDMIDVFKLAVENNNDWSRIRMSAPPDQGDFGSFGEPGANDRGPVTPETERVVRDHLQQEHDVDLQSLPVRNMMIDDLFDTNEQLVLMNDILEKIVDEVAAKSPLPPSDVDRLRFVKESEVLARGFLNDMIQHFMNRPREG